MRNPFITTKRQARELIQQALGRNLKGDLEGCIIGFTTTESERDVHCICAINGSPVETMARLSESLVKLMEHPEIGTMITASVAAALRHHQPEMMKDPIDLLMDKINEHDCGDPKCDAHNHVRARRNPN